MRNRHRANITLLLQIILPAVVATSFLWAALLNGSPFIHPDTLGYFRAGEHTIQATKSIVNSQLFLPKHGQHITVSLKEARGDHFSPERSVYYGSFMYLLFIKGGQWSVVFWQSVLSLSALIITMTCLRREVIFDEIDVYIPVCLFSGAAIIVCTMMPDALTGALLMSISTLFGYYRSLALNQRIALYVIILFSATAHTSHIALSAALIIAGMICAARYGVPIAWPAATVTALVAIAMLANMAVPLAVQGLLHTPSTPKPFLLARMLADGPAVKYLRDSCIVEKYDLCRYMSRLPESENDILWSIDPRTSILATASIDEQRIIYNQSHAIIFGTIIHYPFTQLIASTRNIFYQFFDVGVNEYGNITDADLAGISPRSAFYQTAANYVQHPSDRRTKLLKVSSYIMRSLYFMAIPCVALYAFAGRNLLSTSSAGPGFRRPPRANLLVAMIFWGCTANAAICGALSGVFDRYQGRIAWAAIAVAIVVTCQLWSWHTTHNWSKRASA